MSKKVKLKQQDIENIVKNIINEQNLSDDEVSEPFVDDEEVKQRGELNIDSSEYKAYEGNPNGKEGVLLVKDKNGNIYLIDNITGKILQKFS